MQSKYLLNKIARECGIHDIKTEVIIFKLRKNIGDKYEINKIRLCNYPGLRPKRYSNYLYIKNKESKVSFIFNPSFNYQLWFILKDRRQYRNEKYFKKHSNEIIYLDDYLVKAKKEYELNKVEDFIQYLCGGEF